VVAIRSDRGDERAQAADEAREAEGAHARHGVGVPLALEADEQADA